MLSLVTRKDAGRLRQYFGDDFEGAFEGDLPAMWNGVEEPLRSELLPMGTSLKPAERLCKGWLEFKKDDFTATVKALEGLVVTGGILAYEFTFSPPKSVSVAALAGPEINGNIVSAHLAAVNEALAFLTPSLLDRHLKLLRPAEVGLLRFTHPWNRKTEPQLHSHVLLFRSFQKESRALYGYPFFLHQRALRAVYHFALASRLRREGYAIITAEPGTMGWEIEGISPKVLIGFSERTKGFKEQALGDGDRFFSMAVQTRLAILASRKELPKTDSTFSLTEARALWTKKASPDTCVPMRTSAPKQPVTFQPIALDIAFRQSSILSRSLFTAANLAHWIGSPATVNTAVETSDRWLERCVKRGDIVIKDRGICYPKVFAAESEILNLLADGYARRKPITLKWTLSAPTNWFAKKLNLIVQTADRYRLGSTWGETMPRGTRLFDFEKRDITDALVVWDKWDPYQGLNALRKRGKNYLVLLVREVLHIGDFLQRLERLVPRRPLDSGVKELVWEGAKVQILNRKMRDYLERGEVSLRKVFRGILEKIAGKDKERRSPSAPVILAPEMRSDDCARWNWERLSKEADKKEGSKEVLFAGPVDWSELFELNRWEGMGIFVSSNVPLTALEEILGSEKAKILRTMRQGACWWFTGPVTDGLIKARGEKRRRTFALETLQELLRSKMGSRLHLVAARRAAVHPGVPLTPLVRFSHGKRLFHPGEIVRLKRIMPNGDILFTDNSVWAKSLCLMRPAYMVTEFSKHAGNLPTVLTELPAGEDILQRLMGLPKCRSLIIFSQTPEKIEAALRQENNRRMSQQHENYAKAVLFPNDEEDDDQDVFLPSRKDWINLIVNQPEPIRSVDPHLAPKTSPEPAKIPKPREPVPLDAVAPALEPRGPSGLKKPAEPDKVEIRKQPVPKAIDYRSQFWLRNFQQQLRLIRKLKKSRRKTLVHAPSIQGPEM